MSSIKKVNTSRKKADVFPSKDAFLGSKNIRFHHQATLDDTTIDMTNLNGWISGVANPSPQSMSNVYAFRNNFVLKSATREYELVQGQDYSILGTIITLLNGYEALEDEQFFGSIILPSSNVIASESKYEVRQFELPAGDTLLPVGNTYEVGVNGTQQIGAIKVYRDGKLQLRCAGNDIANEGNYIEVDAGNGYGNQIQFKTPNPLEIDGVVVEFGMSQVSDINVFSDLERLSGSILQLSQDMAAVTGNPVTDYFNASASETDRLTLSTKVLQNEADIVKLSTYQTGGFSGSGSQTSSNFNNMTTPIPSVVAEGSGIINITDDSNGTRLNALQKCKITVNFGAGGPSSNRGFSIRRNGVTVSIGTSVVSAAADHGHSSVTIILNSGDYVSFFSSQSGYSNSRFHYYAELI